MMRFFLILALSAGLARAQEAGPSPAPATREFALPAIKASLQLPEGWYVREQTEDGVTVYQISREKVESENDTFTAGLILSVTPKVPERAEMKPSAYAAELLSSTQEDSTEQLKKTQNGPFETFRTDYQIEADPSSLQMSSVATANDTTGTLYFVTWQAPASEEEKIAPIREAILSSFKFDPAF